MPAEQVFKTAAAVACSVCILVACGCGKPNAAQTSRLTDPVVAIVENTPVTLSELDREVELFNNLVPDDQPEGKITDRRKKLDYLKNEMVQRALLYRQALARGLDKKPEVVGALAQTRQELLIMALLKEEAARVEVAPAEIEEYYTKNQAQMREPEERRMREIVVATPSEAKDVLLEVLEGHDFAGIARQRSIAASRDQGGDLGFLSPGQQFPAFDEAAFAAGLAPGSNSTIFKGPDGFYVIKVEAIRGGKQKTLAQTWDQIKSELQRAKQEQRVEQLVGELSRGDKIKIYEDQVR